MTSSNPNALPAAAGRLSTFFQVNEMHYVMTIGSDEKLRQKTDLALKVTRQFQMMGIVHFCIEKEHYSVSNGLTSAYKSIHRFLKIAQNAFISLFSAPFAPLCRILYEGTPQLIPGILNENSLSRFMPLARFLHEKIAYFEKNNYTEQYFSKKKTEFPFTFRIFKEPKTKLEIFGKGILGKGGTNVVKKSITITFCPPNQYKLKETVIRKTLKFTSLGLERKHIESAKNGIKYHRHLLREFQSKYPKNEIYLSAKMSLSHHQYSKNRERLLMSQKRYVSSFQDLKKMSSPPKLQVLKCIAIALKHMHALGIVHRDVKTANILVSEENKGYLSDFDLTGEIGPCGGTADYSYWDHAAAQFGMATPNCDVYGLVFTAASVLMPNFEQKMLDCPIKDYWGREIRDVPLWKRTKEKMKICFQDFDPFFIGCMRGAPELKLYRDWEQQQRPRVDPEQRRLKLKELFPVEYEILTMMALEFYKSERFLEHLYAVINGEDEWRNFSKKDWERFAKVLNLTTAEALEKQFERLSNTLQQKL